MKNGQRPAHLIPWAPADYLTSRTRMRAVVTQNHMLRLVYREILDVLYAEGGQVHVSALPDLLALPAEDITAAVKVCCELGSLAMDEAGMLTNPRVTRTLVEIADVRERRAAAGREGGKLGGRPRKPSSVSQETLEGFGKTPHNPIPSPIPIPLPNPNGRTSARDVLTHWSEKARTKPRSVKVETAVLKRIDARLREGFSADDLKRCVDVACTDEFYVQRGYYKQPDVIFRNAERIQSLLARIEHARARPIPL